MAQWSSTEKPSDLAESQLIRAILESQFPINSTLPGERDLAAHIGVTRPTLRETLQRMSRDGWLEIHHGKSTRVRNYWEEGNIAVLSAIAEQLEQVPESFIANLLQVRLVLAPAYGRLAVENHPENLLLFLKSGTSISDLPTAYAQYDWGLHQQLTILSGNPVFTLILNGFQSLYLRLGERYFADPNNRQQSNLFYESLKDCAANRDPGKAELVIREAMAQSILLWQENANKGRDNA